MEKQINSADVEVRKSTVTTILNMNSSSPLLNDATITNQKIDYTLSANHSETILSSLLTNKNCTCMKCVITNRDSCKNESNESMFVENYNNNTISFQTEANSNLGILLKNNKSASPLLNIPLDAKKVAKNETMNGFSEFSSNAFYDSIIPDNNSVKKEESVPVKNDFKDILECPQFMRTEKKQYSNDAVNLDELNLSVSKILNSTKPNKEEERIENKSLLTDAPCSNTSFVNKDHSYHLPFLLENGSSIIIKELKRPLNTDEENGLAKKMCRTNLNGLSNDKIDRESDSDIASKSLQNAEIQNNAECSVDIQITKHNEQGTSLTDSTLTAKSFDSTNISSGVSLIGVEETCGVKKDRIIIAEEYETGIVLSNTDGTLAEEKTVNNTVLSTEALAVETRKQLQSLPKVESLVVSEKVESQALKKKGSLVTQMDKSSDPEIVDVPELLGKKPQNTSNEKAAYPDLEIKASEELTEVAETSYVCNECGAKLKTRNSLFTHKKIHLSGAIITARAKKRKLEVSEKVDRPKETKRKRGRPKLVKTEPKLIKSEPKLVKTELELMEIDSKLLKSELKSVKTESKLLKTEQRLVKAELKSVKARNSTETVSSLKGNVAKKVLRNRAQSDEMTQSKSKQNAKAVKENKISNNDKEHKSKRNLQVRKSILTKVISNKSKITARSKNYNNTNKTASKIDSVQPKAKTKSCYSSTTANNLLRKFACPECGMKFKRNDHMKRHQLLHSEKSFQCRDCGMKFYRGDKLKLHTIRYHSIKVSTKAKSKLVVKVTKLPKKCVECHKCGIQFLRIVPRKTDKSGQSRRKISCCISCGAKMNDENN